MKYIITIIMVLTLGWGLYSYSLYENYENYELGIGNRIINLDARSAALGSAATAGGNNLADMMLNPANISYLDDNINAQLSFDVNGVTENRTMPLFNFFDSYVDDATYASNFDMFGHFAVFGHYRRNFDYFDFDLALSYRPFTSYDGYYEEQVRNNEGSDFDNYPPILATNFIRSEGNLYALAAAAAISFDRGTDLFGKSSLALEIMNLSGDQLLEKEIVWSEYAHENAVVQDLYQMRERSMEAMHYRIGVRTAISGRVGLGLMYVPSTNLDVTDEVAGEADEDIVLPSSFRIGLVYMPRNILRTYVNADVEFVQWPDTDEHLFDAVNYYVGLEHQFPHTVPFRLGFRYEISPSYKVKGEEFVTPGPVIMTAISAGTGFKILDRFNLDLAAEFANRSYEAMDLFPDSFYNHSGLWNNYSPQDREDPDTIKESFVNFKTSINFKW